MDLTGLSSIFDFGGKILDKVIPDQEQKAKAKQQLMELQQNGELKELEIQMSAIIMEAKSQDPWTSRARPTFLYVMYAMILWSIPMGFLFAFKPDVAMAVVNGMSAWLQGIPGELYALFGTGYLGYTAYRSKDKRTAITGKQDIKSWLP